MVKNDNPGKTKMNKDTGKGTLSGYLTSGLGRGGGMTGGREAGVTDSRAKDSGGGTGRGGGIKVVRTEGISVSGRKIDARMHVEYEGEIVDIYSAPEEVDVTMDEGQNGDDDNEDNKKMSWTRSEEDIHNNDVTNFGGRGYYAKDDNEAGPEGNKVKNLALFSMKKHGISYVRRWRTSWRESYLEQETRRNQSSSGLHTGRKNQLKWRR